MKNLNPDSLGIPVYVKAEKDPQWPKDKMFYLLAREGLFLCRNHEWFQSCSKAPKGPSELESQEAFCDLSYPLIPRALMERAVGFFHRIYEKHQWEAALILVWNRTTREMELLCPEQKASWGTVKYTIPALPSHLALIGDLHSHGDMAPFASQTDEDDEMKRPGLHIVVGKIKDEPPDFYSAVVADGSRFEVKEIKHLTEDYRARDTGSVPEEWVEKVKAKYESWERSGGYGGSYYGSGTSYVNPQQTEPDESDKKIMKRVLSRFAKFLRKPTCYEVATELFRETIHVPYLHCERKAEKFVDAWDKMKEKHEELISKE